MAGGPGSADQRDALSPRAQVRKEDIVRHAEELFAEHGYAQTRMNDIADAAAVTKGLLYWYFESKDALVRAILVDIREQLREEQRRVTADIDDPLAKIYVGTVASVRFILERWRLFHVNIPPTEELKEVFNASNHVHAADTADILREGQRLGIVRADDTPEALAQGNSGIVNHFCLARSTGALSGSYTSIGHLAARYIVRALAVDLDLVADVEREHGSQASRTKRRARASAARSL